MIRNQLLYPAELRGRAISQRGNPFAARLASVKHPERNGAVGHSAARQRHNFGHIEGAIG